MCLCFLSLVRFNLGSICVVVLQITVFVATNRDGR